jgi:hypothetical protein
MSTIIYLSFSCILCKRLSTTGNLRAVLLSATQQQAAKVCCCWDQFTCASSRRENLFVSIVPVSVYWRFAPTLWLRSDQINKSNEPVARDDVLRPRECDSICACTRRHFSIISAAPAEFAVLLMLQLRARGFRLEMRRWCTWIWTSPQDDSREGKPVIKTQNPIF